jgi:cytoskeletal protein RodZ
MSETENEVEKAEIGHLLRNGREASGASIEDVAAILRIRSDHLRALEDDDYERLPGSVYAIGFIRTYATHLGLNAAELIDRYKAATARPHLEEPSYDPQTEIEPASNAAKIAIVLAAVFLVYLTWLIAGGARQETEIAQTTGPAEPSETLARPVAPSPRPAIAEKPSAPKSETQAETVPRADPLASPPAVDVSPIAELPEEVARAVAIRANRRTWMRIEGADGKVLFSSIIRNKERFDLTQVTDYTLATRDAGALEYTVDGVVVGAVGRRGQILTARKISHDTILALQP